MCPSANPSPFIFAPRLSASLVGVQVLVRDAPRGTAREGGGRDTAKRRANGIIKKGKDERTWETNAALGVSQREQVAGGAEGEAEKASYRDRSKRVLK